MEICNIIFTILLTNVETTNTQALTESVSLQTLLAILTPIFSLIGIVIRALWIKINKTEDNMRAIEKENRTILVESLTQVNNIVTTLTKEVDYKKDLLAEMKVLTNHINQNKTK